MFQRVGGVSVEKLFASLLTSSWVISEEKHVP